MHRFEPVGGCLALDFINTVGWRDSDAPEERLETPSDVSAWARAAGLKLRSGKPKLPAKDIPRLRSFREALYRLVLAFASSQRPHPKDLAVLNDVLASAPERRKLSVTGARVVWDEKIQGDEADSDQLRWAVARSAAKLLTEEPRERIKRCQGEGCGWLFLDASRTGGRRWCSMRDCGNRAKAKRHYRRRRG